MRPPPARRAARGRTACRRSSRLVRTVSGLGERRLDDVRIRLRALRVVARGRGLDESRRASDVEQRAEIVGLAELATTASCRRRACARGAREPAGMRSGGQVAALKARPAGSPIAYPPGCPPLPLTSGRAVPPMPIRRRTSRTGLEPVLGEASTQARCARRCCRPACRRRRG